MPQCTPFSVALGINVKHKLCYTVFLWGKQSIYFFFKLSNLSCLFKLFTCYTWLKTNPLVWPESTCCEYISDFRTVQQWDFCTEKYLQESKQELEPKTFSLEPELESKLEQSWGTVYRWFSERERDIVTSFYPHAGSCARLFVMVVMTFEWRCPFVSIILTAIRKKT